MLLGSQLYANSLCNGNDELPVRSSKDIPLNYPTIEITQADVYAVQGDSGDCPLLQDWLSLLSRLHSEFYKTDRQPCRECLPSLLQEIGHEVQCRPAEQII